MNVVNVKDYGATGQGHTDDTLSFQAAHDAISPPRIPFRARWSLLRQRIILALRWYFRLEIDDLKDRQVQLQLKLLNETNEKSLETIKMLVGALKQMNTRLAIYEQNIPRMRELKRQFDLEQAGLRANNGHSVSEDGILALDANLAAGHTAEPPP